MYCRATISVSIRSRWRHDLDSLRISRHDAFKSELRYKLWTEPKTDMSVKGGLAPHFARSKPNTRVSAALRTQLEGSALQSTMALV